MKLTNIGKITAIFVALLPFIISKYFYAPGINTKYFFVILFVDLLVLLGIKKFYLKEKKINLRHRWLLLSLVSTLFIYFLASFIGVFPEHSLWSDVIRSTGAFFLLHLFFMAFSLGEFLDRNDWSLVRRAIVISAGIFSLLSFLGNEGFGLVKDFLWIDLTVNGLSFGNNTFAGVYLVLAFIFGFVEFPYIKKGSNFRIIFITSLFLIFFSPTLFSFGSFSNPASFLGDARASSATVWLFIIFIFGRFLLKRIPSNIPVRVWYAVFSIFVVIGIASLFTPGSFVQNKYIESSTAARILVWNSSIEAFKERPMLGFGPENFELAFQKHLDNRLYLKEYLQETWFDRAHNVMIDYLIEIGIIGVVFILISISLFINVVHRAKKHGVIGDTEALILIVLPIAHILQLQTSFDTVGSYTLLGIIAGYGLWLERELVAVKNNVSDGYKDEQLIIKIVSGVMVFCVLLSMKLFIFDEFKRQVSLLAVFTTKNSQLQEMYIEESLSRLSSFPSLRLSSASFIKGVLEKISTSNGKVDITNILNRFSLYEKYYREYLKKSPDHYRARMNYAYLLIIKKSLGGDSLAEAEKIIEDSYILAPNNPLTYGLDSIVKLYKGDIKSAKEKVDQMMALNPNIEFSRHIYDYIDKQIKKFPRITVIKLENL